MQNSKYASAISKKCQDTLLALADCASDNDAFATDPAAATITSLSTINGCCTKDCSDKIKAVRRGARRGRVEGSAGGAARSGGAAGAGLASPQMG
jgi:hypothetical protein